MNTMTFNISSLEADLVQSSQNSLSLRGLFEVANVVLASVEGSMCSDCCGSNGNSCSPGVDTNLL